MKTWFTKLKNSFQKILDFFPTWTPIGVTEHKAWADKLLATYDELPDNDSVRFALASMLLHLNPTEARKRRRYFFLVLRKGAAAQIAHGVMEELKEKQKAMIEAEKAATNAAQAAAAQVAVKQAEVTGTGSALALVPNEQK